MKNHIIYAVRDLIKVTFKFFTQINQQRVIKIECNLIMRKFIDIKNP